MVLDDASPSVLGHLSKNIRIAVLKTPLVDEDVGVAASIRIVNPQSMKKQDFLSLIHISVSGGSGGICPYCISVYAGQPPTGSNRRTEQTAAEKGGVRSCRNSQKRIVCRQKRRHLSRTGWWFFPQRYYPVSYTHLDVYKRQELSRGEAEASSRTRFFEGCKDESLYS